MINNLVETHSVHFFKKFVTVIFREDGHPSKKTISPKVVHLDDRFLSLTYIIENIIVTIPINNFEGRLTPVHLTVDVPHRSPEDFPRIDASSCNQPPLPCSQLVFL